MQVSLVDLLGASLFLKEPVTPLFQRYYTLGLFAAVENDWLRMISLKVKKPCPFLNQNLCSIYPVRPLPCILFPEYLVAEGRLAAEAKKETFRNYLCLKSSQVLSPARAEVLAQLKKMWRREGLISSFYLFGHSSCYLDLKDVAEVLLSAPGNPRLDSNESKEQKKPPAHIPHEAIEFFFWKHIAPCRPFSEVEDRIRRLEHPQGQAELWQYFQEEHWFRKIRQGEKDRALIFRFRKGQVRMTRRSLISSDCYCFI